MKIIDKIVDFFFDYKIKPKYLTEIKEVYGEYFLASIYVKLPFVKKHCVWSAYTKKQEANEKIKKAYENKTIVKEYISLVSYLDSIWWDLKAGWLNIIDIIDDNEYIIKKSEGVFKKPIKKWYCGFGIHNRPFKPFDSNWVNHILYINKWSMTWKPKYDYVSFEDNSQMWVCLFKFFWFGYKVLAPVDELSEYSYWEQMIWYVKYSDCDLKKAKETYEVHCDDWNDEYLI
jgi:hypothetical protein